MKNKQCPHCKSWFWELEPNFIYLICPNFECQEWLQKENKDESVFIEAEGCEV